MVCAFFKVLNYMRGCEKGKNKEKKEEEEEKKCFKNITRRRCLVCCNSIQTGPDVIRRGVRRAVLTLALYANAPNGTKTIAKEANKTKTNMKM